MAIAKYIVTFCLLCVSSMTYGQQKNFVLRTIDWGYKIVQGDSAKPHKKYFFPVPIVSYKPETRWQLGLSLSHFFRANYSDSLTRPSVVRLNTSYSQNKQFSVRPMFEIFTNGNKYNIRGLIQYSNSVENYWGIGATTPKENIEVTQFDFYKANIKATRKLHSNLYVGVQAYFEQANNFQYQANSILHNSTVIGNTGYTAVGTGLVTTLDSRNHIYFPTSGYFIDLSYLVFAKELGSTTSFNAFNLDARYYLAVGKNDALALQAFACLNQGNTPYRMLGTLGNESYFRGYYQGRYRDQHAITTQVEYRKQIWGPLGAVVFAGVGNVSKTLEQISQNIKPLYGMGARIKAIPREKINIRLDVAFDNRYKPAFYITLNEAF